MIVFAIKISPPLLQLSFIINYDYRKYNCLSSPFSGFSRPLFVYFFKAQPLQDVFDLFNLRVKT